MSFLPLSICLNISWLLGLLGVQPPKSFPAEPNHIVKCRVFSRAALCDSGARSWQERGGKLAQRKLEEYEEGGGGPEIKTLEQMSHSSCHAGMELLAPEQRWPCCYVIKRTAGSAF